MDSTAALPAPPSTIDLATRRRAEILTGAVRVISRDGVAAAKLKDIARESGVSLGLIQHYFDTRENLVDATFTVMMRVISHESALRAEAIDDPLQMIYAMNRLHVFGTVDFPERWGFWSELWAASGRSGHLREVATQVYRIWAEPLRTALKQLADDGRLPVGSTPQHLNTGLLALMDGLSIRTLAEPELVSAEMMLQILDEWITAQLNVTPAEAEHLVTDLVERDVLARPRPLTPEVVAGALLSMTSTDEQE
ncbi:TetR/AcrR family transcriptional regulator [Leucobacter sp. L43]|uniref:TetR/AcrR family transcriptional regulator n=1 Tax=Leucobacter sp. L43 TaxID=2798040 RepID=UPI001904E195